MTPPRPVAHLHIRLASTVPPTWTGMRNDKGAVHAAASDVPADWADPKRSVRDSEPANDSTFPIREMVEVIAPP